MKVKTSELIGSALDWAVAKIEGVVYHGPAWTKYSSDWAHGGPIIEREGIAIDCIRCDGKIDGWIAALPMFDEAKYEKPAPTPLVAAMRCYVASVLGDEIDIPEGLQ